MTASIKFYEKLGLRLIVNSVPRYCRLEFPETSFGDSATLSLHRVESDWSPTEDGPLLYFEVDDLDCYIQELELLPIAPPTTQRYLWRETDILDPSGNRIRFYQAGEHRRFPP